MREALPKILHEHKISSRGALNHFLLSYLLLLRLALIHLVCFRSFVPSFLSSRSFLASLFVSLVQPFLPLIPHSFQSSLCSSSNLFRPPISLHLHLSNNTSYPLHHHQHHLLHLKISFLQSLSHHHSAAKYICLLSSRRRIKDVITLFYHLFEYHVFHYLRQHKCLRDRYTKA
jgi:uncharacterized Zn-finger protein